MATIQGRQLIKTLRYLALVVLLARIVYLLWLFSSIVNFVSFNIILFIKNQQFLSLYCEKCINSCSKTISEINFKRKIMLYFFVFFLYLKYFRWLKRTFQICVSGIKIWLVSHQWKLMPKNFNMRFYAWFSL